MGKKSKRRDKKEPELYTKADKLAQIITLKGKIQQLGLDVYLPDEIDQLYKDMDDYVDKNTEFYYTKILPSVKRKLIVILRNKKKYEIAVSLPYIHS